MTTETSFRNRSRCLSAARFLEFFGILALLVTSSVRNLPADQYNGAPAPHFVLSSTPASINGLINNGWRPTSIELESNVLGRAVYRVAYVKNEGSHFQEVRFAHNETEAQLNSRQANGWRIEDVEVISSGELPRLSAILIRNVTNPRETFYFHGWNADSIALKLALWNGRLIDLDRHSTSGIEVYSGVMVKNTGATQAEWAWDANATWTQVFAHVEGDNMRVIDLDRHPDGTYAVVFVKQLAGQRSYYFGDQTLQEVQDLIAGGGFRVTSLNETSVNNTRRYSGAMVNNTNPIAAAVADRMLPKHNGFQGIYLREIGGAEIVNLNGDRVFHPSSAIKFLVHYHAADVTPVNQLNTRRIGNRTMKSLCQNMMFNSNNPDTNTLMSFFGKTAIRNNGRTDGPMSSNTKLINDMGTGGPYTNNPFTTTTLRDMSQLYERVEIGDTLGPVRVDWIRWNMLHQDNSTLFDTVNQSAGFESGFTRAEFALWESNVKWIYKAGNNSDPSSDPEARVNGYWTCCGAISLPFMDENLEVSHRTFLYGLFVNDSTTDYRLDRVAIGQLLREQILESMNTFQYLYSLGSRP